MTTNEFTELIEDDIRWRVGVFASIKSLPIQYSMTDSHKQLVMTFFIPAIYAVWEGFVVNITRNFIKLINEKKLRVNDLHISILTHALQSELKFNESRTSIESQRKLVKQIHQKLSTYFNIPTKIQTESNVNYKVISRILDSLNLEIIDKKYEAKLNKLLKFRNTIAHGDLALPVSIEIINEFSNTIEELMNDLFLIYVNGINNEVYKNKME